MTGGPRPRCARVTAPGGRIVMFCPNRFYPFETHGHYWRGEYHFGNTPLINYLPSALRDRFAPHVRAYSGAALKALFDDQGVPRHPPQHHLSRLRQRDGAQPRRRAYSAQVALYRGDHAAPDVRPESLPRSRTRRLNTILHGKAKRRVP